jgi:serine/threonine protein kinase
MSDGAQRAREPPLVPQIIGQHFVVQRVLGSGSFGKVVEAMDTRTGARVAAKLEFVDTPAPQLFIEFRILHELRDNVGFPRCYGYVEHEAGAYDVLIMQRLDKSLEQLREEQGGQLPLAFLQLVAMHALDRLRVLHKAGFVHRDIKPDNFMVAADVVYLIDFGLAKRVVDPDTHVHVPDARVPRTVGSERYTSVRAHAHRQQSRRDDLESLAYMLVYLAKGSLPWQKCHGVAFEDIARVKGSTAIDDLCSGLPAPFATTLRIARELEFEDTPDYFGLISMWETGGTTVPKDSAPVPASTVEATFAAASRARRRQCRSP